MSPAPEISLIICTRNRAGHLRMTLEAIAAAPVSGRTVELILADNGSTDDTPQRFQEMTPALEAAGFRPRYLREDKRGQCHARNSGLALARGEVIVFTDDDVRPCPGWLQGMSTPIREGEADAVLGSVHIASHLRREWMTPFHRGWLASTEDEEMNHSSGSEPGRLIGANMAFARRVLRQVPAFDTELGPGQLGFCDDILFSLQLKEAGFRLRRNWNGRVEHHFDASRLTRAALLERATAEGYSTAYFWYHWLHEPVRYPALKAAVFTAQLKALQRKRTSGEEEGCSEQEMRLAQKAACYRQYLLERKHPRQYEKRGLAKKGQNFS